jgi:hypothetical protein
LRKVQTAQTSAYKDLKNKLKLTNGDLLKFIKTKLVRDYNGQNIALYVESPESKNTKG